MKSLLSAVRSFGSDRRGNLALVGAVLAPVLFGLAGAVVDLFVYVSHEKMLQNAADGAALAAAHEASLGGWSPASAHAVADAYVRVNISHMGDGSGLVAKTDVDKGARRVTVTVEQDHFGYFVMGYFKGSPQIRTTATATASGSMNVCVIGLDKVSGATIGLDSNSILFAPNCAVYSNSAHTQGMKSLSNSVLTASMACSSGGYQGASKNYSAFPITDCPVVPDPLAGRLPPVVSATCKATKQKLDNYVGNIGPGTYCGGLEINGNSKVTLLPGVYVMKNGPLYVDSNSIVSGVGVGVYFTGTGAHFHFKSNVNVSLEAPTDGAMAGLIFFQDRSAALTDFTIESNYTRNLLGTIYLPKGNLVVKADNDVADQSAYTAIVVHRLQLFSGPRLVLNTDYSDTTVPVPAGLGPTGGSLRLID